MRKDTSRYNVSGWDDLVSFLPADWECIANEMKVMKGARQDKDLLNSLRALFMHLGLGYSLKETAVRAELAGLCNMSGVALFGRLKKFGPFFKALCEKLFEENQRLIPKDKSRFRLIDATDIQEPGETGSSWRFHYSFSIPSMVCDYTKLTSNKGKGTGETLTHFPIKKGDMIIADRGYSHARGVEHVKNGGGDICVRLNNKSMPVYSTDGEVVDIVPLLRQLSEAGAAGEWNCYVKSPEAGTFIEGRICAIKKDDAQIFKSHKRSKLREAKKRRENVNYTMSERAFFIDKFIVVFTTFDKEKYPLRTILEIYRWRWQIELVFKRFKSLLELGHLPKTTESSSRAWLYGKLLIALIIEKINALNGAFSPWREKIGVSSDEEQSVGYVRFRNACCPAVDITSNRHGNNTSGMGKDL